MEKLSRTKKYQALRDSLQNDAESQVVSKDLSSFQDRLNRLDVMHFDTQENTENHDPIHARKTNYFEEEPVAVVKNEPVADVIDEPEIEKTTQYTFNNEYLDSYINEVKEYNKNKGLLSEDDTAMNILEGLKKKEEPVVEIKEEVADYTNELDATIPFIFSREKTVSEVSEEVKSLVMEIEEDDEPVVEKTQIALAVEAELEKEKAVEEVKAPVKPTEKKAAVKKPVVEEDDEDEDDDDDSMDTANKILNVILVILILALLVVLGVVVYWTLMNRGII